MGQRANLILIEDGKQTIYYNHWCANTLDMDLFWGPEHAAAFIRIQRKVDDNGLLDDVWAEGAAVVDRDHKVLLFFGGEDILHDVPLRRVYLQMIRRVWQGWDIRWAYEGIADIADYLGYPRSKVLTPPDHDTASSLDPGDETKWTQTVVSVRFENGTQHFYPLQYYPEEYLNWGPDLLKECDHHEGYSFLPLDEWLGDSHLDGGFCIDIGGRQLDYWIARDIPGFPEYIANVWAGWTVNWHRDAFETQLADGNGQLRFPTRSEDAMRKQLADQLIAYEATGSLGFIQKVVDRSLQEGKDVQINPWALRDDRLKTPEAIRREIVAKALG